MMDPAYIAAGALTGVLVGLTGVGGGALMTPILLLVFGISPVTAIATDLWFAAITKIIGANIHQKANRVDWLIVKRLWLGSLPVALIATLAVGMGVKTQKLDWLSEVIGVVVLITALALIFAPKLSKVAIKRRLDEPEKFKKSQPLLTVFAGAVLGLCVSLTSIGAGALGSVMLIYLYPLRMTPHKLVGTDIVHAIPLAIVSGLGFMYMGLVNFELLASLLVGSIPCVILGGALAGKISSRAVQVTLATVLIATSTKVLLS